MFSESELYNMKKILELNTDIQLVIAIEELSELQKLLCKYLRFKATGRGDIAYSDIVEEVADVEIMLQQLKMAFDIKDYHLENITHNKLRRLDEILLKSGAK